MTRDSPVFSWMFQETQGFVHLILSEDVEDILHFKAHLRFDIFLSEIREHFSETGGEREATVGLVNSCLYFILCWL